MNLLIVVLIIGVFFALNEARKGEVRVLPYSILVAAAVIGVIWGLWLLASALSPE